MRWQALAPNNTVHMNGDGERDTRHRGDVDASTPPIFYRGPLMNPRDRRLDADARKIRALADQSDLIDVRAIGDAPGRPPEMWEATYRCKGIIGKNADDSPVYGEYHRVRIELGRDYPLAPPAFKWLTPILHPNIEGREPHRVCIDQTRWQAGRHLDSVILMMGEMVQYKNYHAEDTPPYPLDHDAAIWAKGAERAGYFSKTRPVDPRPLLRPANPSPQATEPSSPALRRVRLSVVQEKTTNVPLRGSRVRLTGGPS
jgi:ubiquitin-protein ligase